MSSLPPTTNLSGSTDSFSLTSSTESISQSSNTSSLSSSRESLSAADSPTSSPIQAKRIFPSTPLPPVPTLPRSASVPIDSHEVTHRDSTVQHEECMAAAEDIKKAKGLKGLKESIGRHKRFFCENKTRVLGHIALGVGVMAASLAVGGGIAAAGGAISGAGYGAGAIIGIPIIIIGVAVAAYGISVGAKVISEGFKDKEVAKKPSQVIKDAFKSKDKKEKAKSKYPPSMKTSYPFASAPPSIAMSAQKRLASQQPAPQPAPLIGAPNVQPVVQPQQQIAVQQGNQPPAHQSQPLPHSAVEERRAIANSAYDSVEHKADEQALRAVRLLAERNTPISLNATSPAAKLSIYAECEITLDNRTFNNGVSAYYYDLWKRINNGKEDEELANPGITPEVSNKKFTELLIENHNSLDLSLEEIEDLKAVSLSKILVLKNDQNNLESLLVATGKSTIQQDIQADEFFPDNAIGRALETIRTAKQ